MLLDLAEMKEKEIKQSERKYQGEIELLKSEIEGLQSVNRKLNAKNE